MIRHRDREWKAACRQPPVKGGRELRVEEGKHRTQGTVTQSGRSTTLLYHSLCTHRILCSNRLEFRCYYLVELEKFIRGHDKNWKVKNIKKVHKLHISYHVFCHPNYIPSVRHWEFAKYFCYKCKNYFTFLHLY